MLFSGIINLFEEVSTGGGGERRKTKFQTPKSARSDEPKVNKCQMKSKCINGKNMKFVLWHYWGFGF